MEHSDTITLGTLAHFRHFKHFFFKKNLKLCRLIYIPMRNFDLVSGFSNVIKDGARDGYGSVPTTGAPNGNR